MGEIVKLLGPAPGEKFSDWYAETQRKTHEKDLAVWRLKGAVSWLASTDDSWVSDKDFRELVMKAVRECNEEIEAIK